MIGFYLVIFIILFLIVNILEIFVFIASIGKTSFYEWAQSVKIQASLFMSCQYMSLGTIPDEPVIFLCNHIKSGFRGIGSYISLSFIVRGPCKIICYKKYGAYPTDTILQHDIRIEKNSSGHDKEIKMIEGIKEAIKCGEDVFIFIDPNIKDIHTARIKPIRKLLKRVLESFPSVYKVYCNIDEIQDNTILITQYIPNKNLNSVIESRVHHIKKDI